MNKVSTPVILVTGKNGQVGWELQRSLMLLGRVVAYDRHEMDFTDLDQLRAIIRKIRPNIIVNAAAYTAVDKAEQESELAFLINAEATEVLAAEAKECGALLIHFSTDYVFDGTKDSPYTEADLPNPGNIYGESKLAGEQAIISANSDHIILRTSWVYAARGNNFLHSILRLAAQREELNIVADQTGTPTWARLIAEVTAHITVRAMQDRLAGNFSSGVYHLTSAGETTWHGFAKAIVEVAQNLQGDTKIITRKINPIPTQDYPTPAIRPANSRLAIDLMQQHFGIIMPDWQQAMRLCLQELEL